MKCYECRPFIGTPYQLEKMTEKEKQEILEALKIDRCKKECGIPSVLKLPEVRPKP